MFHSKSMVLLFAAAAFTAGTTQAEEQEVSLDKVPSAVTAAVMKMYPTAKLVSAEKEMEEDEEIEYELTLEENGQQFSVTVELEVEINEVERPISPGKLPPAVTEALKTKHPHAKLKSAEAIYEIEDGQEELEFYEVQLTIGDKSMEVEIKPNGKIVTSDDDGDNREEEEEEEDESES